MFCLGEGKQRSERIRGFYWGLGVLGWIRAFAAYVPRANELHSGAGDGEGGEGMVNERGLSSIFLVTCL